jgi:hypothetical protein
LPKKVPKVIGIKEDGRREGGREKGTREGVSYK